MWQKVFWRVKELISIVVFYPELVANNLARHGVLSVYALYKHIGSLNMQQNSGGSVAKHKHDKKQSGMLWKPFINEEKERKKCVHRELPREAMRQCGPFKKYTNINKIRKVAQHKCM